MPAIILIMNNIDYENILKYLPDPIVVLDSNQDIVFANDRFRSVFKQDNIGGNIKVYIPDINFDGFEDGKFLEKYDVCIDDENVPLKVHAKKSPEGYVLLISLVEECICIDSLHMDFVSTVSHELRTPLTSMKGFIDTLLASGDKLDETSKTRFLTIVQQQIARLTRLVEDLLTVSKLEGQKSKNVYKSVNLNDLCEFILEGLKSKHSEHIFDFNASGNLPEIWVDYDKAQQVLTNLIDNAAKYSYPKSRVVVNVIEKGDDIEVSIKDQGVGISREYLPKIFNKFARIDNPLTREVQGTGLGLYITKTLVENMGGEISVESEEGKGSIFRVLLPITTAENQAKQRFISDVGK